MFTPAHRKALATALAGAALASALAVSGASADPHALDAAAREEAGLPVVPPPPSRMAESAADEYKKLRARGATDEIPPQQGSYPVGEYYQELPGPDTRDRVNGYAPTLESPAVADQPSEPSGFDWVSAAIGAVAALGLSLVLMATVGTRLPLRRRTETA